ncbi:unnamed protein product [Echinostoma caproni]|uniref:ULP_PROTEASE domain-containing protein n=1 Tax=Echinostoma caproni TaxID=27848 RepID=A0A183A679_9TREM|nr:unnamed protein product [Echinostoma caproni]
MDDVVEDMGQTAGDMISSVPEPEENSSDTEATVIRAPSVTFYASRKNTGTDQLDVENVETELNCTVTPIAGSDTETSYSLRNQTTSSTDLSSTGQGISKSEMVRKTKFLGRPVARQNRVKITMARAGVPQRGQLQVTLFPEEDSDEQSKKIPLRHPTRQQNKTSVVQQPSWNQRNAMRNTLGIRLISPTKPPYAPLPYGYRLIVRSARIEPPPSSLITETTNATAKPIHMPRVPTFQRDGWSSARNASTQRQKSSNFTIKDIGITAQVIISRTRTESHKTEIPAKRILGTQGFNEGAALFKQADEQPTADGGSPPVSCNVLIVLIEESAYHVNHLVSEDQIRCNPVYLTARSLNLSPELIKVLHQTTRSNQASRYAQTAAKNAIPIRSSISHVDREVAQWMDGLVEVRQITAYSILPRPRPGESRQLPAGQQKMNSQSVRTDPTDENTTENGKDTPRQADMAPSSVGDRIGSVETCTMNHTEPNAESSETASPPDSNTEERLTMEITNQTTESSPEHSVAAGSTEPLEEIEQGLAHPSNEEESKMGDDNEDLT